MYEIKYDKKFLMTIKKVPIQIRKRIMLKLDDSQLNPMHYFVRLQESSKFKLRVGDYRVIADIDFSNKIIYIRLIGHRKNIYEK